MGQLLVFGGFIDAKKLESTLCRQRLTRQGQRPQYADATALGRLLHVQHAISEREMRAVLQLQARLRSLPLDFKADGSLPDSLQLALGQLLLANGAITREQLERALAEHQRRHQRLGEVLVARKVLTRRRLSLWLKLQRKLVAAAAAAAFMLGGLPAAAADEQARFREKFWVGKARDVQIPADKAVWGQPHPGTLSGLRTVQKAFGELVRSRDGSTVVSIGDDGLEITKRF